MVFANEKIFLTWDTIFRFTKKIFSGFVTMVFVSHTKVPDTKAMVPVTNTMVFVVPTMVFGGEKMFSSLKTTFSKPETVVDV